MCGGGAGSGGGGSDAESMAATLGAIGQLSSEAVAEALAGLEGASQATGQPSEPRVGGTGDIDAGKPTPTHPPVKPEEPRDRDKEEKGATKPILRKRRPTLLTGDEDYLLRLRKTGRKTLLGE